MGAHGRRAKTHPLAWHLQPARNAGTQVERKAKSAAAREWAVGMQEAVAHLETENAGFAGAVEREALLLEVGRAEAHDWAGAYEDIHNYIGGHLPWPLQEAEQPGPANGHSGRASQGDQPHQPTL